MPAGFQVVQGVENDIEGSKPVPIKLTFFDIRVVRFELCVRLELVGNFFCDLSGHGDSATFKSS